MNIIKNNIFLILILIVLLITLIFFNKEKFEDIFINKTIKEDIFVNPNNKEEENEFLNPDIYEYGNDNELVSFEYLNDKNIDNSMEIKPNYNMFKDNDSNYEDKILKRQFFTTPNNGIDKKDEFINWTCLPLLTCKENQKYCTRWYDNIRERNNF